MTTNPAALGCRHPRKHGTPAQCSDCPAARTPPAPRTTPPPAPLPPLLHGPCPLDTARDFAATILWMPPAALDALTLIAAASHALDAWDTVPRILASSDEPQSGKTTLLDVLRLLTHNPWDATGATPWALRARFAAPEPPFIIIDEISDVFGASGRAGAGNLIGLIARHGYRRTARIPIAVARAAEDIPAFGFMAMGGLKTAVPADIRTRSIVFRLTPVPAAITLPASSTDPETEALGAEYRASLHSYVRAILLPRIRVLQRSFTPPHPAFRDRKGQIFRALAITAAAADDAERARHAALSAAARAAGHAPPPAPHLSWAARALAAFKTLMLDTADLPVLEPPAKMTRDAAAAIRDLDPGPSVFAADLLAWLRDRSPEPLWGRLTDRTIELLMTQALGPSTVLSVTAPDGTRRRARGWMTGPVLAAWDSIEASLYPPATAGGEDGGSLFNDLPPGPAPVPAGHGDHGTHSPGEAAA